MELEREVVASVTGSASMSARTADHRARLAAAQDPDDAGLGDPGPHLEPERPQVLGDQARGLDLTVRELGILVETMPDLGRGG